MNPAAGIVPYEHVLALAGLLFLMGLLCAAGRRNLVMILLGAEVMLNAAAIAFVAAALRWGQAEGQTFVLFILAVAAAEVSVGLALVLALYRRSGSLDAGGATALPRGDAIPAGSPVRPEGGR
jgi:NADH-quinone oxidoreductase subunit K